MDFTFSRYFDESICAVIVLQFVKTQRHEYEYLNAPSEFISTQYLTYTIILVYL